jgi:hypothetical protein
MRRCGVGAIRSGGCRCHMLPWPRRHASPLPLASAAARILGTWLHSALAAAPAPRFLKGCGGVGMSLSLRNTFPPPLPPDNSPVPIHYLLSISLPPRAFAPGRGLIDARDMASRAPKPGNPGVDGADVRSCLRDLCRAQPWTESRAGRVSVLRARRCCAPLEFSLLTRPLRGTRVGARAGRGKPCALYPRSPRPAAELI